MQGRSPIGYPGRGGLSRAQADAASDLFAQHPIDLWQWHLLSARDWQLRANAMTYDSGYVALARLANATLVTCDARLESVPGTKARGATARVEVFAQPSQTSIGDVTFQALGTYMNVRQITVICTAEGVSHGFCSSQPGRVHQSRSAESGRAS